MDSDRPPAAPARLHRLLAVAWIALLWLPILQMTLRPFPEGPTTTENRRKARPQLPEGRSFKAIKRFADAFEKYFNDTFGFRDALIRANNFLHVRALQTSPLATVVLGSGGWLYFNNEAEANLADYSGLSMFSEQELETIERNLTATRDALRRRGVGFALLIAPSKHTIYPEHLPEEFRRLAGRTRLDQLAERLAGRSDLLFVDPRRLLRERKARELLYFPSDTHWNSLGAFLAGEQLLGALAKSGVALSPAREGELSRTTIGVPQTDIANMLALPPAVPEQDVLLRGPEAAEPRFTEFPLKKGQIPGRGDRTCETGSTGRRLLLVHDSFGQRLAPTLCRAFSHGYLVFDARIAEKLVAAERPDVVVLEVVERHLHVLLNAKLFLPQE